MPSRGAAGVDPDVSPSFGAGGLGAAAGRFVAGLAGEGVAEGASVATGVVADGGGAADAAGATTAGAVGFGSATAGSGRFSAVAAAAVAAAVNFCARDDVSAPTFRNVRLFLTTC